VVGAEVNGAVDVMKVVGDIWILCPDVPIHEKKLRAFVLNENFQAR
jgi:hypothetical protein